MLSRSRLQVGLELTYPFPWVKTTPLVSYGWNSSTWLFPVAPAWRIQASRGSFKRWGKLLKTTDWSALSQLLPPEKYIQTVHLKHVMTFFFITLAQISWSSCWVYRVWKHHNSESLPVSQCLVTSSISCLDFLFYWKPSNKWICFFKKGKSIKCYKYMYS